MIDVCLKSLENKQFIGIAESIRLYLCFQFKVLHEPTNKKIPSVIKIPKAFFLVKKGAHTPVWAEKGEEKERKNMKKLILVISKNNKKIYRCRNMSF